MSAGALEQELGACIARWRRLLEMERGTEISECSALQSGLSPEQLEARGMALTRMRPVDCTTGLFGRTLVTFESAKSLMGGGFSLRDVVRAVPRKKGKSTGGAGKDAGDDENGEEKDEDAIDRGVIYELRENSLTVSFERSPPSSVLHGLCTLLKLPNDITYNRYEEALAMASRLAASGSTPSLEAGGRGGAGAAGCLSLLRILFANGQPAACSNGASSDPPSPSSSGSDSAGPSVAELKLSWCPVDPSLNDSQLVAIDRALASRDIFCIHGPPGTGKTTTVAEMIRQAVAQGKRVLACAPSNIAVDNLTEKLAASAPAGDRSSFSLRVVRVGHPARLLPGVLRHSLDSLVRTSDASKVAAGLREDMTGLHRALARLSREQGQKGVAAEERSRIRSDRRRVMREMSGLRRELKAQERRAVQEVTRGAQVVLATLTAAAGKSVREAGPYDMIVIDEAGQSIEPACLIPIMQAGQDAVLVLAGDHHQLPPTVRSEAAAREGLAVTLFDRLAKRYEKDERVFAMLRMQYRMHEAISNWASHELYGGALVPAPSVARHLLSQLPHVKATALTSSPLVVIDTAGCEGFQEDDCEEGESRSNRGEAQIVAKHVKALVAAGLRPHELAVITPYAAQVRLLYSLLSADYKGLEIGTVDGFQGREKEAIVISMVRSNQDREVGFLAEDRRTNVAVTRARRHVCVIVDSLTASAHPFLERLLDYAEGCPDALYRSPADTSADPPVALSRTSAAAAAPPAELPSLATLQAEEEAAREREKARVQAAKEERRRLRAEKRKEAQAQEKPQPADGKGGIGKPPTGTQRTARPPSDPDRAGAGSGSDPSEEWIAAQLRAVSKAGPSGSPFAFPASLSARARAMVHDAAEKAGLHHYSRGEGAGRHIVVAYKPPAPAAGSAGPGAAVTASSARGKDGSGSGNRPLPVPAAGPSALGTAGGVGAGPGPGPGDRTGGKDDKGDGNGNGNGKGKGKGKGKSKVEKAKERAKAAAGRGAGDGAGAGAGRDSDDEFGALIAELRPGKCKAAGCEAGMKMGGFVCEFCKQEYCHSHMNPIFHGCAEEAKRNKRQQLAQALAGPPKPKLSDHHKEHLKRKLHEKASAREIAAKEKKKQGKDKKR